MNILTFTTLYPNAVRPHHGVFVENRLRHVVATGEVRAQVVAPVPWFPLRSQRFGAYAEFAQVPRREERHGITVHHPRYAVIPKIGMSAAPFLMYAAVRPYIARLLRDGATFDLIDAHYFYPDGVAAAMLGRHFGQPVVITARGSDLNVIANHAAPRRMMRAAARRAAAVITVCRALAEALPRIGFDPARAHVLRNGVDLEMFRPVAAAHLRARLGLAEPLIASVGNLTRNKGHDLVIRALARLPEASLVVIGGGPEEERLVRLTRELGLERRVRLLGAVRHEELREYYSAASVLVLASAREGWANVLLEAMACGTPVAATRVGGLPEVVTSDEAGRLIPDRTPEAIAATIAALLADPPARAATRAYAERFSWDETTRGIIDLLRAVRAGVAPPSP